MKRILTALLSLGVVCKASAFTCFLTLVKDSCWTSHDVQISLYEVGSKTPLVKGDIPKGKSWSRVQFDCSPGISFNYFVKFEPPIWDNQKGKVFKGKSTWSLPKEIEPGKTAWNITICFPAEFAEVPAPMDQTANCACNVKDIPPVKPPEKP